MGVKACSRKECDNIMCDIYIPEIGYICHECKNEFKDYLKTIDKTYTWEGSIKRALIAFMETYKDKYLKGEKIDIDEFFKRYDN